MIPLKLLNKTDNCGGCTVCCNIFHIPEIDKMAKTSCKHICNEGCNIHNLNKPDTCKNYMCIWREFNLFNKEEYRPDNLGVLFDTALYPDFGACINVRELKPNLLNILNGIVQNVKIRYLINKIKKKFNYPIMYNLCFENYEDNGRSCFIFNSDKSIIIEIPEPIVKNRLEDISKSIL